MEVFYLPSLGDHCFLAVIHCAPVRSVKLIDRAVWVQGIVSCFMISPTKNRRGCNNSKKIFLVFDAVDINNFLVDVAKRNTLGVAPTQNVSLGEGYGESKEVPHGEWERPWPTSQTSGGERFWFCNIFSGWWFQTWMVFSISYMG